ncbi:MAG: hypothetical protein ACP5I3_10270 [Thermoproteus sp.]
MRLGSLLALDGWDVYKDEGMEGCTVAASKELAVKHYISDLDCASPCFLGLSMGSVALMTVGDYDTAILGDRAKEYAVETALKAVQIRAVLGREAARLAVYRAYLAYKGQLKPDVRTYDFSKVQTFLNYALRLRPFKPRQCYRVWRGWRW